MNAHTVERLAHAKLPITLDNVKLCVIVDGMWTNEQNCQSATQFSVESPSYKYNLDSQAYL